MGTTTPSEVKFQAQQVCEIPLQEMRRSASGKKDSAENPYRPVKGHEEYFCLDLVYIYVLLTKGFDVSDHSVVTLMKKVYHQGKRVEAAWSLGAAISAI